MGYCTDLTDKQWQVIENLSVGKERMRKYSLRSIFNGIFFWLKPDVNGVYFLAILLPGIQLTTIT